MISFSLTKPRSPGIPGFYTEVWLPFLFHRQLLHGLAATAGIPLRAEQRSNAFRGRVEKSVSLRYGESGQIKLDRKFRRSGISHRLPRTGSHPFVLRIVAVGSVSFRSLQIRQLANQAHAQLHAERTWTRRAGCDSERCGYDHIDCCWEIGMLRHFSKNGTLPHHESDSCRKAQAFFLCFTIYVGSFSHGYQQG